MLVVGISVGVCYIVKLSVDRAEGLAGYCTACPLCRKVDVLCVGKWMYCGKCVVGNWICVLLYGDEMG